MNQCHIKGLSHWLQLIPADSDNIVCYQVFISDAFTAINTTYTKQTLLNCFIFSEITIVLDRIWSATQVPN